MRFLLELSGLFVAANPITGSSGSSTGKSEPVESLGMCHKVGERALNLGQNSDFRSVVSLTMCVTFACVRRARMPARLGISTREGKCHDGERR